MADIFDTIENSAQPESGGDVFDSLDAVGDIFDEVAEQDDPSLGQVGAGLGAEVLLGEGGKLAGAAAGTAVLPGVGTAIGYAIGAISGGVSGSLTAQEIEGRDEVSWGRVVADTLINFVPGSKAAKGGKFAARAGSAALRQGAAGAVIAPSAQAVESVIEEGELPTASELGSMSLVGGALGSSLGISSEAASNLYKKFAGMKPEQIQARVLKGDEDAVKLVDAVAEAADVDKVDSKTPREYLSKLAQYTKARVAPSRVVGKDVTQIAKEAKDTFEAGKFIGGQLGNRISKAVKVADDPEIAEEAVFDYLAGRIDRAPPQLSKISTELADARKEIYVRQKQILDNHYNGSRRLPEPLLNEIEESMNRGDYLTREYQFFENFEYKPSDADTRALKNRLRKDGMEDDKIEGYLADLNSKRSSPDNLRNYVFSTPAGILKERKDLSPELRKYLGEITDPGEKVAGTISRLARLTAFDTADARIRDIFLTNGVAKRAGEGIDDATMRPLNLRRGAAVDADGNQLYVDKDVQRALDSMYAPKADIDGINTADNLVRDAFGAGIASAKAAKVLLNPPSYMVQVFGNLAGLAGMGMNPFRGSRSGVKFGLGQFQSRAANMSPKDIQRFKRAIELDLAQPGVSVSDIRKGLEGKFFGAKAGKLLDPFGKAYSVPDIMFRVSAWENYQRFLRKAVPSFADKKNQARLEELAAKLTNDTYQNYSFLNEGLKTLSKYGVLGQFAAFSLELIRNQYNQSRLIREMLNGRFGRELSEEFGTVNERAIRKEGAKRLAALTGVYAAATGGITMYNRNVGDVSEEEERAYRDDVLPEWDRTRELVLHKGKDGKIYHKNASYLIPHAQMAGVITSAMRGEDFQEAASNALGTMIEDIGGEGNFMMNAIVPAVQNYVPGKEEKISKATGRIENISERFGWFVDEAFMPGLFREVKKATSETDPQPASQTALRQAGIRINDTTINEGAGFKIRSAENDLRSIARDYGRAKYRLTGDELNAAYDELNGAYQENFQRLIGHAQGYKTLGMGESEVIKLLKDNGISGRNALLAIDGKMAELPRANRDTPTSRWEAMEGKSMEAKRTEIRQIDDKAMRDSLLRKWDQVRSMERRGISERDKVVMSLGVSDGTRAEYIYERMRQSESPEQVLQNYRQKRIATKEVVRQIRLRQ